MSSNEVMDLRKSYDFFHPESVRERIHIIGCGSVGSTVAENLARFGLTKFSLYDFDRVESKNIVNQMFTADQVGMNKTAAVAQLLERINPRILPDLRLFPDGYKDQSLNGYVFLCADSIDLRRGIVERFKGNLRVKAMFDFRTRLTDAQHYAAQWDDVAMVDNLLRTMQFTDEQADQDTPVSACGITLGVATTVRVVCALGCNNFLNLVRGQPVHKFIQVDAFQPALDAF